MGAAPPLMTLRDLLELACESSCSEGFRTYPRRVPWRGDDVAVQAKAAETAAPPVRLIIEAGLRRSPSQALSSILLQRSPAGSSLAAISRLSRSLSRRLAFWRRHRGDSDDDEDGGSDAGERDSLGLPSPLVSSCSASECSEPAAEAADLLVPEEQDSGASEEPSPSTSSGNAGSADDAAGDGHKAQDGEYPTVGSSVDSAMDDKQQLSPVSVMDFPFHHDDDGDERSDAGTCSPSFLQRQPVLERSSSAHELPHKVRRLDGLAQAAVDPADLEPRFVASDDSGTASVSDDTRHTQSNSSSGSTDHDSASATTTSTPRSPDEQHRGADDAEREPDEHHRRLFERLFRDTDDAEVTSVIAAERLLILDFFAEELERGRSPMAGTVVGTVKPSGHDHDEAALVRAAHKWMLGLGTQWGVEDVLFAGPAALADMDRERRWMCVGEEEREVGAAVEGLLVDALVAELVRDMAARC